jgi:hypothetical protein
MHVHLVSTNTASNRESYIFSNKFASHQPHCRTIAEGGGRSSPYPGSLRGCSSGAMLISIRRYAPCVLHSAARARRRATTRGCRRASLCEGSRHAPRGTPLQAPSGGARLQGGVVAAWTPGLRREGEDKNGGMSRGGGGAAWVWPHWRAVRLGPHRSRALGACRMAPCLCASARPA